jgi:hypothetical protein
MDTVVTDIDSCIQEFTGVYFHYLIFPINVWQIEYGN